MNRIITLICILFFASCDKSSDDNEVFNQDCDEDCAYFNPIGFVVEPMVNAVLLQFGSSGFTDGIGIACNPDAYDIYMSENGNDFLKVTRIEAADGSFLVEDLEEDKEYAFKLTAHRCGLDSLVTATRIVSTRNVPLPQFIDNPLPVAFEDFRLAPDGDRFIYRSSSDTWYLTSFSNPVSGNQVFKDVFHAHWSKSQNDKIAGVEKIEVSILPNLNGLASKTLISKDLVNVNEEVLHEIENHWDFNNDIHNPDLYWIHEFQYSLDGNSIYFLSNKNNGSANVTEQKVFDNIWKLDLTTNNIEPMSDFLPINFELIDFVEDPKQQGNFYVLGGIYGEEIEGDMFFEDRVDVHYYNSFDQSLTEILRSDAKENYLSIAPNGENLVFVSDRTGLSELWSYNLNTQKHRQITSGKSYSPSWKWHYLNWISETKFMCFVRHNETSKFAVFDIR